MTAPRVKVFIDLFDLQTGLEECLDAGETGVSVTGVIDWDSFPQWLASVALGPDDPPGTRPLFDGAYVYVGYDPSDLLLHGSGGGPGTRAAGVPAARPDLEVVFEKRSPRIVECRICDRTGRSSCTRCRTAFAGTTGTGLSSALAADLFRLLREEALERVVLMSSDRGLVPVVELLQKKGKKVVHAGSGPPGDLARVCWARIDLGECLRLVPYGKGSDG